MSAETIDCEDHGKQKAAYVCQHIVMTLDDGQARGFVWTRDEDGAINAYCDACDAALEKNGGEWTPELEAASDMGMLCEMCTAQAARINGEDVA